MRNYTDKYVDSSMLTKVNTMFESLVDYSIDKKNVSKEQIEKYYAKVSDDIVSNMYENQGLEEINKEYFSNQKSELIPSMYDLKNNGLDNDESYKQCLQQTYLLYSNISIDDINKNFLMGYEDFGKMYIPYNKENIKYEDAKELNIFLMIKQELIKSEIKEIKKDFSSVQHNPKILSDLNEFILTKEKTIEEYNKINEFILDVIKSKDTSIFKDSYFLGDKKEELKEKHIKIDVKAILNEAITKEKNEQIELKEAQEKFEFDNFNIER